MSDQDVTENVDLDNSQKDDEEKKSTSSGENEWLTLSGEYSPQKTGRRHFPQRAESHLFDHQTKGHYLSSSSQRSGWLLTVPKRLKQKKHFKQHNSSQVPI